MEALFKQAADSNHPFLFSFSMLEIYMGYLKDLLVPRTTKATEHMPPWYVSSFHFRKKMFGSLYGFVMEVVLNVSFIAVFM